ncbi:MAG TPA: type II secretion system protein [Amycolatopsis sp.]|nr:type II secretion system protein [Amycolatopsis sp.]
MSARGDRGETLLELLVAVVILGIAGVAIAGGLITSVRASDIHRKQATAGAAVRDYAETIETAVDTGGGYVACGTPAYTYAAPPGFSRTISQIQYWTGSAFQSGCTSDSGLQRLTLQVASSDGRASEQLVVVIRKPCGGSSCT